METTFRRVLEATFPGEEHRYFHPISVGNTPADADHGAALILGGIKTATSTPFWDYPDGRIPFVGALSVLIDGSRAPRGIVETSRIEIKRFGSVDAELARDYGEGLQTLEWWIKEMGAYYVASAARHSVPFSPSTEIICEWFRVVHRPPIRVSESGPGGHAVHCVPELTVSESQRTAGVNNDEKGDDQRQHNMDKYGRLQACL
jgi:uncharacterized protein YhfF